MSVPFTGVGASDSGRHPPLGHLESPPAGQLLGALQQALGCPRRSLQGVETLRGYVGCRRCKG
eukprot:6399884-Heterocapsa_arctica.AAC.1